MSKPVPSPYNSRQQTAFTSLLVGVFLNSPIFPKDGLPRLVETSVFAYYGQPFLDALDQYSTQSTMRQIDILHKLQQ